MLWSSFLKKQALAGSLQNSWSKELFGKVPDRSVSVLNINPPEMFCWKVTRNFWRGYFFKTPMN